MECKPGLQNALRPENLCLAYVACMLQGAYPDYPGSSQAQLRIYNSYNCSMSVAAVGSARNYSWTVDSMGMMKYSVSPVSGVENLTYSAELTGSDCPDLSPSADGTIIVYELEVSYINYCGNTTYVCYLSPL